MSSVSAQDDNVPDLWAGIQTNTLTTFQVNSMNAGSSQSQGIVFSISDFEQYRFGINFHLFRGFNSAVDFLYGGGVFYAVVNQDSFRLKGGINISRFAVNDYRRENDVVGGKIEDQFPETFKPYLEIEWPLSPSIVLAAQGGYRISKSDITTIEEIFERYPDGSPFRLHASDSQKWYGSGWEFGLGLYVKIY